MNSLKTYPGYAKVNESWPNSLPSHWKFKQVRQIFNIFNGATPKSTEDEFWGGDIVWITPEDLGKLKGKVINDSIRKISESGYESCGVTIAKPGSIAISTRAPIGHIAITSTKSCVNQGCRLIEPKEGNPNYWYYCANSSVAILQSKGQGTTFMELPRSSLASTKFPVPPPDEQQQIADFLDYKTAKIDALIAKKETLLLKLQEKRAALITQAVTKGLNLNVPMKPSGVEWLGNVPAHWDVVPIKFALDMPITDGPHSTPEFIDEGIPFLSAESVKNDELDFNKKRGFISAEDHATFSKKYRPKCGDVYMVKSGATTGNVARVKTHEEFNIWSPLAVLRPHNKKSTTDFIFYVLKSKSFFYSVELSWSFGTQQNIGMGVISNIRIALPPISEQIEICEYLTPSVSKLDKQKEKIESAITKLQEFRSALITNAVTGKIDVRDFDLNKTIS